MTFWKYQERQKTKRSEESEMIKSSPYKAELEKASQISKLCKKVKTSNSVKKRSNAPMKKTISHSKTWKQPTPTYSDCECLVCGDWWHDSLPGDKWVQCTKCLVDYFSLINFSANMFIGLSEI